MKAAIVVFVTAAIQISQQQFLIPPIPTVPEAFPYHAYIKADWHCLGALISTRYVVVDALCIETHRRATVYLGTRSNPYYHIFGTKYGQVIKDTVVITHPDFSRRFSDSSLINNVGLVHLLTPALITMTVRPIALPTKRYFPLRPGTLVNITGYTDNIFDKNDLHFTTVKVQSKEKCILYYGRSILAVNEYCVETIGTKRMNWPGPVAKNGKLVGLSRVQNRRAICYIYSPACSTHAVFLSLEGALDWLYDNSDNTHVVPWLPLGISIINKIEFT